MWSGTLPLSSGMLIGETGNILDHQFNGVEHYQVKVAAFLPINLMVQNAAKMVRNAVL